MGQSPSLGEPGLAQALAEGSEGGKGCGHPLATSSKPPEFAPFILATHLHIVQMRHVALPERVSPMNLRRSLLLMGLLICAFGAQAGDSLSCRVHSKQIKGTGKTPVIAEFIWSAAHGTDEPTGLIETSIGQIGQGDGSGPATVLTLNGKALSLPASLAGSIRFGRSVDYGGKVALAYLVERQDDSSASPSQVVLLLGQGGAVLETDLLPGTAPSPDDHCVLIQ